MTKTTNYQLPQWEANDPIRREDFNGAMANLDAGLTAAITGMETERANDRMAAAESIGQLWDGLMYGAERDLLAFRSQADAGETPADPHIFYNKLDTAAGAQTLTGAQWDSEKHIYLGTGTIITLDDLKASSTASELGFLTSTSTAYYYFTAPGKARFTRWSFMLMTFFSSSTAGALDVTFQLRAEKKEGDAWSVVFQSENIPVHTEGTTTTTLWTQVPTDFTTEWGAEYRIAVQRMTAGSISGAFGLTSTNSGPGAPYSNDIQVEFTPIAATDGGHIKELSTVGTHRALVLARYNAEPSEGGVMALWNDTALDCAYRDGTDRNGEACRELRALAKGPFQENSALKLELACGEADDLCLLDYIVYLL